MHRRGHLSTKIPNVKLRPAPPSSRGGRKGPSPMNAADEEIIRQAWRGTGDEESSSMSMSSARKPWEGVVITFTGIENKPYLTRLANELGAIVESALTISVTHVVASGFGSAKYLYAVEHRLPVLAPTWIQNGYAKWLKAEELDLAEEMETHKLKPFVGLRIAISGIEPLDRRRQLVHYISHNGGVYSKDLDRKCSHLVSAKTTTDAPSEKVKWAVNEISERENKRKAGKRVDGEDMRIVYEEWIWDCLGYEGRWKEDEYDARGARRSGRISAEDVLNGKVVREEPKAQIEVKPETTESNEPAVMRKRKREALDSLVGELISTTAIKVEPLAEPSAAIGQPAAKQVVQPALQPTAFPAIDLKPDRLNAEPVEDTKSRRHEPDLSRKPSMLHTSRATSFTAAEFSKPQVPFAPSTHTPAMPLSPPPTAAVISMKREPTRTAQGNFYAGYRFSHNIDEHCEGLENALVAHGGTLITEQERMQGAPVDFVVVRLCSAVRPTILPTGPPPTVVTECWVEGCCFEQRMLSPLEHLVFQPLPAPMPIPGATKFLVHLSGFSTGEMVYLKRLLRAIGGIQSVKLNRQTTHLVCAIPAGQKYDKSLEWGVSVVRDTWLFAMGRSATIEAEEKHRHDPFHPAMGPSGPKLTGRTGSTSNMSAVSLLNEPMDFARIASVVAPSSSLAPLPKAVSQQSISPSRKLKLTPTHIDGQSFNGVLAPASGSIVAGSTTHPLSPPKPETERLLNNASPHSIDAKLSRMSSAPAGSSPRSKEKRESPVVKAATMGGLTGRKEDMTEVLRQLAQTEQTTPGLRTKIQRRARPPSRLRTSLPGFSPMTTSVSPRSRHSSPTSQQELDLPDTTIDEMAVDESMAVKYIDPVSVREQRKWMNAVSKGPVLATVGEVPSPSKRTRGKR